MAKPSAGNINDFDDDDDEDVPSQIINAESSIDNAEELIEEASLSTDYGNLLEDASSLYEEVEAEPEIEEENEEEESQDIFADETIEDSIPMNILQDFKDAFAYFDTNGDGLIESSNLKRALRIIDQCPPELLENDKMDLNTFLEMMVRILQDSDDEEDIRFALQVFDKEQTGFVSAHELRHCLTNMGDKLTDAEVDEMIRGAEDDGIGLVNYEELVSMMMCNDDVGFCASDQTLFETSEDVEEEETNEPISGRICIGNDFAK